MPTLSECKKMIAILAMQKGWGWDVGTKIFYAMIELGEAGNLWKHREDKEYLTELGIDISCGTKLEELIAEELIDAIYYCLHALHCLNPKINPDDIFIRKYEKNIKRNRIYVDDTCYET